MATGTRSLGIQQSAIDFLGGGQFGCTRTPVETTRRSIVERKQRRCVRSAVNPPLSVDYTHGFVESL